MKEPNYRYDFSGFTIRKLTVNQIYEVLDYLAEMGFVFPSIEPPKSIKTLDAVWGDVMKKKKGKGRKC